ncbi:MAG: hypothetical protein K0Q78_2784, partial [Cellvibrio sp.]|nr:hypothetical protein [Cellvibrio sp.]
MKIHLLIAVLLSALLSACGGDYKKDKSHSSSSKSQSSLPAVASSAQASSSSPTIAVGVLVDAFVVGISYRTPTQAGVTNAQGEFNYLPGETVTFSIGALEFPPLPAKSLVTPLDMAQSLNPASPVVLNIARLLQSLDVDGDPANGISISPAAALAATQVDFNLDLAQFASSTAVTNLIANSGSTTTTIVSVEQALTHLRESLIEAGVPTEEGSSSSQSSIIQVPVSSAIGVSSVKSSDAVIPALSSSAVSSVALSSAALSSPGLSSAASSTVLVVPGSAATSSSSAISSSPGLSSASSTPENSSSSSSLVTAGPDFN